MTKVGLELLGQLKRANQAGVSGNTRFPLFPGIQASNFPSLSVAFQISLPVPRKRKFWPGIRMGNTIIIFSFEHFLMCSLYKNIIFTLVKKVSVLAADGLSGHKNK